MANKVENELLPCLVIGWFDDVLVYLGKQHCGLEANAHERLCAGLENRVHGTVQRVEVIAPALGQEVEILLDEQTNDARMQRPNLGDAVRPHRVVR